MSLYGHPFCERLSTTWLKVIFIYESNGNGDQMSQFLINIYI